MNLFLPLFSFFFSRSRSSAGCRRMSGCSRISPTSSCSQVFLGGGLGCLLAKRKRDLMAWFPLAQLLVIVAVEQLRLEVAVPSDDQHLLHERDHGPVVAVESTLLLPRSFRHRRAALRDRSRSAWVANSPRVRRCAPTASNLLGSLARSRRVCAAVVAADAAGRLVRRRVRRGAAVCRRRPRAQAAVNAALFAAALASCTGCRAAACGRPTTGSTSRRTGPTR